MTGNYAVCPFCGGGLEQEVPTRAPAGPSLLVILVVGALVGAVGFWVMRGAPRPALVRPSWDGFRMDTARFQAESRQLPHFGKNEAAGALPAPTRTTYRGMTAVGSSGVGLPTAMTLGPDGRLYLAGKLEHRIVALSMSGETEVVAGAAKPGYADGPADEATFKDINDLTFDGPTLYVADHGNAAIRRLDHGSVTTVMGGRLPVPKGLPRKQLLATADAVGFDDRHNMYVLDAMAQEVFVRTDLGEIQWRCDLTDTLDVRKMAVRGDGTLYLADAFHRRLYRSGPGEPPRPWVSNPDKLFGPQDLALDPGGHLFLLGSFEGSRLDAVGPTGQLQTLLQIRRGTLARAEQPAWGQFYAMAAGPRGVLYLADDQGKVWKYD